MPELIKLIKIVNTLTTWFWEIATGVLIIVIAGIILDRIRKNKAHQKFKSAFTDLIFELDAITEKTERHIPVIVLQRHIDEIKKAMIDFSHMLSKKKSIALNNAWISFSCEDHTKQKPSQPPYYKYLLRTSIEIRDRIKTEIDSLFEIK